MKITKRRRIKSNFTSLLFLITLSFLTCNLAFAQCNINACGTTFISANQPVFNTVNKTIVINNVTFANIGCNLSNINVGIDFYVYQVLPDGSRVRNCNVLNPVPNNTLGIVKLDLGQSPLCNRTFNVGSIVLDDNAGFEICDGGRYEIEMAAYATSDLAFKGTSKTVDSQLSSFEYKLISLGIVEANITNTFSGGQSLIVTEVSDWSTRSSTTKYVPCNTDVNIYVQGQSIMSDCTPLGDYTKSIPSQMTNTFSYTVNGGQPIIIEDASTGASGGQLSGSISGSRNYCYGGIITDATPYIFRPSNLVNACNGTTVKFTISTFDTFTNRTKASSYTIVYGQCVPALTLNNIVATGSYTAAQTINSGGTIANNANVVYQSGSMINLNNNFTVNAGSQFLADISPCQ